MHKITRAADTLKWIILFSFFVLFFFTFYYADIITTQNKGIHFFQGIISGNFRELYDFESIFYIPVHIIMGIWCLPVTLLEMYGVHAVDTVGAYLWSKLLVVLFGAGCVCCYRKMLMVLDNTDPDYWVFLLCGSPLFWSPTLVLAQYDVLELFFGMWAVLLAAREKELSWKTLLLMSITVSCKLIFAFGMILLLLVKEKRIAYLLRDAAILLICPALLFIVFRTGIISIHHINMSTDYMSSKINSVALPGLLEMPLFYLVFFGTCAIAYFCMFPENGKELIVDISWLFVCVYVALVLLVSYSHPFWAVVLPPFLLLLAACEERRQAENIIAYVLLQFCIFLLQIYLFDWVFLAKDSFKYLLLRNYSGALLFGRDIPNGAAVIVKYGLEQFLPAVSSFALTIAMVLLVRNNVWYSMPERNLTGLSTTTVKYWTDGVLLIAMMLYIYVSCVIGL